MINKTKFSLILIFDGTMLVKRACGRRGLTHHWFIGMRSRLKDGVGGANMQLVDGNSMTSPLTNPGDIDHGQLKTAALRHWQRAP